MKEFMAEFTITTDPASKEFQDLLPAETKRVQELLANGEFKGMWIKEDLSGGYCLVYVETEQDLQEILESLPLIKFLDFKTYPLKPKG